MTLWFVSDRCFRIKKTSAKKFSCISDKVCFCNNSRYLPQRIRWLRQCELSPSEAEQNRKLASWLLPQLTGISTKMIQEQSPQGHAHQLFHSCFWFESFNRSADLPFQATSSPSPHGQVVNSKRGLWLGSQQKLRLSNLSFTVVGLVVLSCRICQNMQVVRIPEDTSRIFKVTSVHLLVKGKKTPYMALLLAKRKQWIQSNLKARTFPLTSSQALQLPLFLPGLRLKWHECDNWLQNHKSLPPTRRLPPLQLWKMPLMLLDGRHDTLHKCCHVHRTKVKCHVLEWLFLQEVEILLISSKT